MAPPAPPGHSPGTDDVAAKSRSYVSLLPLRPPVNALLCESQNIEPRLLFCFPPTMNTDVAAQQALDRLAKVGFDLLAEREKVLAAVWTFEAQITYRGFRRYFSSAAGDMADYVTAAFKIIGASQKATIAANANEVFGKGDPPKDRKARKELVQAFGANTRKLLGALETEFYESPEDADELLEAYLNKPPKP